MFSQAYRVPSSTFSTLGATSTKCRWVKMGENWWVWTCFTGQERPAGLRGRLGAAVKATAMNEGNVQQDPTGRNPNYDPMNDNAPGFDIMQFLGDNWIWIAVAIGGILVFTMMSKKRR